VPSCVTSVAVGMGEWVGGLLLCPRRNVLFWTDLHWAGTRTMPIYIDSRSFPDREILKKINSGNH
jgi:hypothetical protein